VIVLVVLALGSATLTPLTTRLAKPGRGAGGAVYLPVTSILPILRGSTPTGGINAQVTAVFVVPVTIAVNCWTPFTGTVTLTIGSIVIVVALAEVIFTTSAVTIKRTNCLKSRTFMWSVLLRYFRTYY